MPSVASNIAIIDVDISTIKKSIERENYSQIIHVLKGFVEATTIIKRILDIGVNFIDRVLLISMVFYRIIKGKSPFQKWFQSYCTSRY